MKSPFRKLVRISVVLLVLVLLFNFFGYYINRIRSLENKELIEAINRSGHQQTLSQRITKEAILILNSPDQQASTAPLRDTLSALISQFQQNQALLQQQAGSTPPPVPQQIFQIKLLLSTAQSYLESMTAIGQEIAQADSMLLVMNKKLYTRNLLYNETKYNALLNEINQHYSELVSETNGEVATVDTGKLISLIIAIVGLAILVLEPAFKK